MTGGNSSPLNDGAAALLLMSADAVRRAGVTPLARYAGSAAAGVHPDYMGIGPVPAMHKALGRAGWRLDEIGLLEINEAFAAQSVAVVDELKADPDLVNVNGGAIAIGHPLGCSGARIVTTLLHEMRRRGAARGAATMCIGVGQGIASLWEAPLTESPQAGAARAVQVKLPASGSWREISSATRRPVASASLAGSPGSTRPSISTRRVGRSSAPGRARERPPAPIRRPPRPW